MSERKIKFRKSEATQAIQDYLDTLQSNIDAVEDEARGLRDQLQLLKERRTSMIMARDAAIEQFTEAEDSDDPPDET